MTLQFRVRDRDHPDYDTKSSNKEAGSFPTRIVSRKGAEFQLSDGEIVELFTISVIAEAMDRTPQSLLNWERKGVFPKPLFKAGSDSQKRWYSSTQITNLHRLVWGKYHCRKNHTLDSDQFFGDIKELFYQPDVVLDENGEQL